MWARSAIKTSSMNGGCVRDELPTDQRSAKRGMSVRSRCRTMVDTYPGYQDTYRRLGVLRTRLQTSARIATDARTLTRCRLRKIAAQIETSRVASRSLIRAKRNLSCATVSESVDSSAIVATGPLRKYEASGRLDPTATAGGSEDSAAANIERRLPYATGNYTVVYILFGQTEGDLLVRFVSP